MNTLALDYGTSHIGVALATGPLAEPLTTIPTKIAPEKIKELVDKLSIEKIIIGRPDGIISSEVNKFVTYLANVKCELEIVDETLSSHDARTSLLHTSQARRHDKEHSVAAAIILQSWLDSNA